MVCAGYSTTYSCIVSVDGPPTPLNRKCFEGAPCYGSVADPLPELAPPVGWGGEFGWTYLDTLDVEQGTSNN